MVDEAGLGSQIVVDSAGTHDYHVGEPPDPRAQAAGRARGYDLSALRARRFEAGDFVRFDLVLAMDRANHEYLARLAAPANRNKLKLMMDYARRFDATEVPDPYYGGAEGFELMLDMLEDASARLLAALAEGKPAGIGTGRG